MDEEEQKTYVLRQPSTVPGLVSVPSASLPDELIRRLSVYDPVSVPLLRSCEFGDRLADLPHPRASLQASNEGPSTSGRLGVRLFCQVRTFPFCTRPRSWRLAHGRHLQCVQSPIWRGAMHVLKLMY